MSDIRFTAKVNTFGHTKDGREVQFVNIPKLGFKHCDMDAFKASLKWGWLAWNHSEAFIKELGKIRKHMNGRVWFHIQYKDITIKVCKKMAHITLHINDEVTK